MDREGMTPGRFADSIGIQRSALSHILNGRNNPSLDVLMKVLSRFDYLSTDWLMFGAGPMFKHQTSGENEAEESHESCHNEDRFGESDSQSDILDTDQAQDAQGRQIVIREVIKERTISRIMIFYSDNTFENFVPENPGVVQKI